jgi:hypothetical protein
MRQFVRFALAPARFGDEMWHSWRRVGNLLYYASPELT